GATGCRADGPGRRPAGRRRLAPGTHDPVMAGVAVRQLGARQIRDEPRLALELGPEIPQFDVEPRNAVAQLLALRPNVGRQLALLLHESRVDLGGGVALCLELVQLPRERAATNVEGFEL